MGFPAGSKSSLIRTFVKVWKHFWSEISYYFESSGSRLETLFNIFQYISAFKTKINLPHKLNCDSVEKTWLRIMRREQIEGGSLNFTEATLELSN